jgi:Fic family protein
MREFGEWLSSVNYAPEAAFTAHRKLVAIHPFNDGNGRTARLLMNLILARSGYPPIAIRPEDRPAYIAALEIDQAGRGHQEFDRLLYERLDRTLDLYISAARQASEVGGPAVESSPGRS